MKLTSGIILIIFLGLVSDYLFIKPIRKENDKLFAEVISMNESRKYSKNAHLIHTGKKDRDFELLTEIRNKLEKSESLPLEATEIEGNTIILYTEDFGDLIDVYNFENTITRYFPELDVKRVKKKVEN